MFTFSGVIVESADAGGVVPARNRDVSFVDAVTGALVTFADGSTVVTTDLKGRFAGLQHSTLSQIKPVVNGFVSEDIVNAAFDVGGAAKATADASAAAVAAAAAAQAAAASMLTKVSIDVDGVPYFDPTGTTKLALDTDGTPYFII